MESDSPERWATITELLGGALELDPGDRAAFLDRACAADPGLRAEVEELLEAYERSQESERFSRGAADLIPLAFPLVAPTTRVGAYRLLHEVGRGGMGTVWLGERSDGVYEQQVAVKIMRSGHLPGEQERRFRAERRILARLQHPNIARILDGGVSDEGHPYLVMEYVEGLPITRYCNENALDLEARLRLFLEVCDAVAYAHQNLVVHRDLKPSNILVTSNGEVKLLDFGIAKLLDSDDSDEPPVTRPGLAMMTPEYAAPEQITGETVTTATDVYALGIVLYELMTDERPYRFDERTPSAIEKVVAETKAPRPSTVVRNRTVRAGSDPAAERLARRLRGDLDTIVLKALAKEPHRRYAAAVQLAEDVRRHRDGLPVLARPDTAGYRLWKFARRHRAGVAAGSAVALALMAGLIIALIQVRVANIERQKADAVNAFLLDMLGSPDPYADGPDVRVMDVLDRAERTLPERLRDRPQIEASVRQTLGIAFFELGQYDRAERHLTRAVRLHEDGGATDDLIEVHAELGRLRMRQGNYEAADSLLSLALRNARRRYGSDHPEVAARLAGMGALRWEQGDYAAAEPLLLDALRIFEASPGADSLEIAGALDHLATLRSDQGRLEEAEALHRRSLALYRRSFGDDHPAVPQALSHIGIIRDDLEHFEEARALHREALALFRRIRGEEHPDVAYALSNLSSAEANLGNFARAESLQHRAIEINVAAMGADHPTIGILYNNMGSMLRRVGQPDRALEAYRSAVSIWRAALPPGHPYLAYGLQNIGAVLYAEGRPMEAISHLEEAYEIRGDILADDNPERAVTASWYGAALAATGNLAPAESLLEASVSVLRDALGPDHTMTVGAVERLEEFHLTHGR